MFQNPFSFFYKQNLELGIKKKEGFGGDNYDGIHNMCSVG